MRTAVPLVAATAGLAFRRRSSSIRQERRTGGGVSWRLATTIVAALCAAACGPDSAAKTRSSIIIATGGPGGALYPLALDLEQVYSRDFPDFVVKLDAVGSSGSVDEVQNGSAQLGFAQADIAYLAYSRGTIGVPTPHGNVRGIAVLWSNTAQIAVPRDSPIQSVGDLRGKRVAVGTSGTSTDVLARIILKAYGLRYEDIHPAFISFDERVKRMREGRIDAAFVVTALPAPAIEEMQINPGIRLVPIDGDRINTLRGQYPFLRPVAMPRRTYAQQETAVAAVSIDELLICRKDLDENLVYQLTKAFFDALPTLAKGNAAARTIDLDEAPGTPIPLHPGAARYYREREIGR
jgi:uncharacterized protein